MFRQQMMFSGALILSACTGPKEELSEDLDSGELVVPEPSSAPADTSAATETGTSSRDDTGEAGSGEDTSSSSDTGSNTDRGAEDPGCTEADLIYIAEVRDEAGLVKSSFLSDESITAVARISNPCATNITITTNNSCLVSSADMVGVGFWGWPLICSEVETDWMIAANSSIEQIEWASTKPAGSWTLTVRFTHAGAIATTSFTVTAAN